MILETESKTAAIGGGGRPDMAQAGGTKPAKLDAALSEACEVIEKIKRRL